METILTEGVIKTKLASGATFLSLRRIIFQIVLTVSNIILARILAPQIFGSFAIISFLVSALAVFTTGGLFQAVVQQKKLPSKQQLQVIFTVLLITSCLIVVLIFFAAPLANIIYQNQLSPQDLFWLRLLSLQILLVNLSAMPMALLEKKLDYKKLTIVESSVLFFAKIITIILALKGLGIGSFVIGELVGAAVGLLLFYNFSPCSIGLNLDINKIKKYFLFGLDIQLSSIIGFANGAVIPGFVGVVSGFQAVGFINWAGGIRQMGLAPNDTINRMVFPVCSQTQKKNDFLKKIIEKTINISSLLSLPLLAIVFALAKPITVIIYTSVWLGGLTALYLGLIQAVFIILDGIMMSVLMALGQAKTYRNITIFWAVLQWLLTIPLVLLWNFNGVMLAGILVSATFFIPLHFVKKKVAINIWPHFLPYLLYSAISGLAVLYLAHKHQPENVYELILFALAGMSIYSGLVYVLKKKELFSNLLLVRHFLDEKTKKTL